MRKVLYTFVSVMGIGLISCNDNNPNKILKSLQKASPALIDLKSSDDKPKERKRDSADNLEMRVERETEAKEQQKLGYRIYSKEELTSIDQIITNYKKTFESAGYRGDALEWLNYALDEAKDGKLWMHMESSIRIAKEKRGYIKDALCNPEEIIREVYSNLIKTDGPKHVLKYLDIAKKDAKSGELLREVEWDLDIAEEYANAAGIELDEKEKREVIELYKRGIKENGPKKAANYLREAAETLEKCGSVRDIQWSLHRAREYAKEGGFEIIGKE